MKVSKRDIMLLIGFVGVLAVVCVYFFVYKPTLEKVDTLTSQNAELQKKVLDLSDKMKNKDEYEKESVRMKKEMTDIYQVFPVDMQEEDAILLAINQEIISPMDVNNVVIATPVEINFMENVKEDDADPYYEIDQVEQLENEEGTQDAAVAKTPDTSETTGFSALGLYDRQVTLNYTVSYDGLKRSIKHLCMQPNRTGIQSVNVTYDEATGLLSGSTVMDMYYVPGQEGKLYLAPDFSHVLLGTENPFGTITMPGEHVLDNVEDMLDEISDAQTTE